MIDEDSRLTRLPHHMTSEEIVSIIDNLVENSLDEVKNDGTGIIYIKIFENEKHLNIQVKNNGMFIVKKIIDAFGGMISLECQDGVFWNIIIPMKRGDELD